MTSEPVPQPDPVTAQSDREPSASDRTAAAESPNPQQPSPEAHVAEPPNPEPHNPEPPSPESASSTPPAYRIVRPRDGRRFAGVCAGLGQASGTDPLLWRVILFVLMFFGGLGLLMYLVVWLFTPGDDDTASPLEALFGRGTSRTSPLATLALGGLGGLLTLLALRDGLRALIVGALFGGFAVLFARTRPAPDPRPSDPGGAPTPPTIDLKEGPFAPHGSGTAPFAPHGPFAGTSTTHVSAPSTPMGAVRREPEKRERSVLGQVTGCLALICIGLLALADAIGASVPGPAYVVLAISIVGLGLCIGAWFGRARWLIALAVPLLIALVGVQGVSMARTVPNRGFNEWRPQSVEEIAPTYRSGFGTTDLDLSEVDFAGQSRRFTAEHQFGDLRIILPPNVDAEIRVRPFACETVVFGRRLPDERTSKVIDQGSDGEGGGSVTVDIRIRFGELSVTR